VLVENDVKKLFVKSEKKYDILIRGSCYCALEHKSIFSSKHSNVRGCCGANYHFSHRNNLDYYSFKKHKRYNTSLNANPKGNAEESKLIVKATEIYEEAYLKALN
jgi:hypothetical protein